MYLSPAQNQSHIPWNKSKLRPGAVVPNSRLMRPQYTQIFEPGWMKMMCDVSAGTFSRYKQNWLRTPAQMRHKYPLSVADSTRAYLTMKPAKTRHLRS